VPAAIDTLAWSSAAQQAQPVQINPASSRVASRISILSMGQVSVQGS
jgi:hypothetical protein